jgi:hypothetical protein
MQINLQTYTDSLNLNKKKKEMDPLSIDKRPVRDESLSYKQYHSHTPYIANFENGAEIRIPINQQDVYTQPGASVLHIEGKLVGEDNKKAKKAKLVNNAGAFLFDEIRYEVQGHDITRVKNLGVTSTMKNTVSLRDSHRKAAENAGWVCGNSEIYLDENGNFSLHVPLSMLMGFAEDFKKVVVKVRQELVLIRAGNDDVNAIVATDADHKSKLTLTKISWDMPYLRTSLKSGLALEKLRESSKRLFMNFRTWETHEYSGLPQTDTLEWSVKTLAQADKPRFVLLAFQTGRKNKATKDMAKFDACKLKNVKAFLNSEEYPYEDLKGDTSKMYRMFIEFQKAYYNISENDPAYTYADFRDNFPIYVIDCSRQNESVKSGVIDLKLKFEMGENIKADTTAYCVLIYDSVLEYVPITGNVRRINFVDAND